MFTRFYACSYVHVHGGRQRRLPTLRLEEPLSSSSQYVLNGMVNRSLPWHGTPWFHIHLKTYILFKYTWFHITCSNYFVPYYFINLLGLILLDKQLGFLLLGTQLHSTTGFYSLPSLLTTQTATLGLAAATISISISTLILLPTTLTRYYY